ncbi:MAG: hypothetical protein WCP01_03760 [Methylococcaceae bacterium]
MSKPTHQVGDNTDASQEAGIEALQNEAQKNLYARGCKKGKVRIMYADPKGNRSQRRAFKAINKTK